MLISFASELENLKTGKTTPRVLYERHMQHLNAREPDLKAFAYLNVEEVGSRLDAAGARWVRGESLSPIDGMIIGIKDVIETIDMPTGQNSPLFEGTWTKRDAASVQALRAAGAIIIGKTTTAELATTHPAPTRNPHDLARTPGGSSSGSAAAVGSGMLPAALGTQVVGSILRPASYCGAFGYKPTFGALNRGGAYDQLSHSCIGVLGASLPDIWAVSQAIGERVGGDPGHVGITLNGEFPEPKMPKRLIALQTEGWTVTTPGARVAFAAARQCLIEADIIIEDRFSNPKIELLEKKLSNVFTLTRRILAWEWRWPLITYFARDSAALSPSLQQRLSLGQIMTLADYREALSHRDRIRALFHEVMEDFDGAIALAATGVAPVGMATGDASMNVAASLLGVPAMSLPVLQDEGLPLGLQIIGAADEDAKIFATATALQNLWCQ